MMQRLWFLSGLIFSILLGVPAFAETAKTDVSSDMLVGVWCGEIEEYEYSWRHIARPDGTFSTYFESFPDAIESIEAHWVHGRWLYDNGMIMQFSTSLNRVGEEEVFDGLPVTDFYEVKTLTNDLYKTYYAGWDTIFVSTRCPDASTS